MGISNTQKERTAREKTIAEARRIYWQGIKRAWEIYAKDDETVKQAREALEKAIHQANEVYLKDDAEWSEEELKLFMKAIRRAHDDYAETVAQVWRTFTKDMKKKFL